MYEAKATKSMYFSLVGFSALASAWTSDAFDAELARDDRKLSVDEVDSGECILLGMATDIATQRS